MSLLVTFRGLSSLTQILEGLVFVELGHLEGSRVLPFSVPIVLVKLDGMIVVSWDLIAILVVQHHAIGPELGLVGHAEELLVMLG